MYDLLSNKISCQLYYFYYSNVIKIMHKKIQISVDLVAPFSYKLITNSGCVKSFIATKNKFNLHLSKDKIYQIVINDKLTRIFTTHSSHITVNSHTTVATIFCFAQLLNNNVQIDSVYERLLVALAMVSNFIDENGNVAKRLMQNPNALETNSWRLFNFLTNIIEIAINDKNVQTQLQNITNEDTILKSLLNIAKNPFNNINQLFLLGKSINEKYMPTIESENQIGQFTLTIKVNTTGDLNYLPGGPGIITFDKYNQVWISLNTVQGTDGSNTFSMVLQPNAEPTKFSPVFPVLGGAYGISYDKKKNGVVFGSFGWGSNNVAYNPFKGSISVFDARNGKLLSKPAGYDNNLHRVQGIVIDSKGNYWMCSWGSNFPLGTISSGVDTNNHNSALVVYLNGNPKTSLVYEMQVGTQGKSPFYGPFAISIDSNDNVFVNNGGNSDNPKINSSVVKFKLDKKSNQIIKLAEYDSGDFYFYKGNAINSKNELYVASLIQGRILKFDNDLNLITYYEEITSGPWGVHVDNQDAIWFTNFLTYTGAIFDNNNLGVTKLVDNNNNITKVGKFTLPSGGDPVRLATGELLLNDRGQEIFFPLMRATYAIPDASGNLYVTNNWKPNLIEDITDNPGGDGIVVFVGIGAPRKL